MTRSQLQTASDHLSTAAEKTDEESQRERLTDLADQIETLAEADHGPDHGRLARFENALLEINRDASAAVVKEVTAAHEALKEYRSGVEGV